MPDTSPLAEAIEVMLGAAHRAIDGPGQAWRDAAVRFGQSGYDADEFASDSARIALLSAKSAWDGFIILGEALSILAEPPTGEARFVFDLPAADVASGEELQIGVVTDSLKWDWWLAPAPNPLPVVLPVVHTVTEPERAAGKVELRLKPAPLVAACTVDLRITRVGSATSTVVTHPLDLSSQEFE